MLAYTRALVGVVFFLGAMDLSGKISLGGLWFSMVGEGKSSFMAKGLVDGSLSISGLVGEDFSRGGRKEGRKEGSVERIYNHHQVYNTIGFEGGDQRVALSEQVSQYAHHVKMLQPSPKPLANKAQLIQPQFTT